LTNKCSSQSFFTIYRNLFSRLQSEETWFSGKVDFPSFGYSTWSWSPPNKNQDNEAAKHFYLFWLNFSTEKDFVWDEKWDISEAPDRRVRRCVLTIVGIHFTNCISD